MTSSGAPATFERDASPELRALAGDAEVIDYDAVESRLELRGGARLIDGANSFNGHKLVYLVEEDRLLASSNGSSDQQISVVITPTTIEEARDRKDGRTAPDDAASDAAPDAEDAVDTDPAPPPAEGEPTQ